MSSENKEVRRVILKLNQKIKTESNIISLYILNTV